MEVKLASGTATACRAGPWFTWGLMVSFLLQRLVRVCRGLCSARPHVEAVSLPLWVLQDVRLFQVDAFFGWSR